MIKTRNVLKTYNMLCYLFEHIHFFEHAPGLLPDDFFRSLGHHSGSPGRRGGAHALNCLYVQTAVKRSAHPFPEASKPPSDYSGDPSKPWAHQSRQIAIWARADHPDKPSSRPNVVCHHASGGFDLHSRIVQEISLSSSQVPYYQCPASIVYMRRL